jgi:predicted ATPase
LIKKLKLRNFKSIQNDEIEFKPLTIFTGHNSSGKSNVIQSIATISQIAKTAQTTAMTFPGHLEYEHAEYYKYPKPSIEFLAYKGEIEREIMIEIHISSEISKRLIGYSIKYVSDQMKTDQVLFLNQRPMFHISFTQSRESQESIFKHPLRWKGKGAEISAQFVLRPEVFQLSRQVMGTEKSKGRELDLRLRENASRLVDELTRELARIYLISAPRGVISIETQAGPDPTWVGKSGENLIYILSKIYGKNKYRPIQQKISAWSEKFGLGNIGAGLKKGTILGADFEDPTLRATFDMNSASYGSRQLLTIVTQTFWSKAGDVLLIEEPEISLHPESQALVQELFAEAVGEGKQIICTTHSPSFILSLSRVIRKEKLSKNDVVIFHVEKGTQGTKTRRLELDDRGFVKGWIPSYISVENELFNEWAEGLD